MARIMVGRVSEIPPGKMKGVEGGPDGKILVANVNGRFYAMNAVCHHEGGPLDEGELNGKEITCPWHGSVWDVTTGKLVSFMMPLDPEPIFKVLVEGDKVFVET